MAGRQLRPAAKFGKLGSVKIATWNVNSLRARADRVEAWLQRTDCDVLAIQETKCKDDNFPWELFENMGYEVAHFGLSQWNGVAIASRVGLDDVERTFLDQPVFGKNGKDAVQEARAIGATCGGIRVWSLYVPNGRALDDEHMPYKLSWLDTLRTHAEGWVREDPEAQIALMGDWNIAPQDDDVWDIDYFRAEGLTHVSDPERAAFHAFENAGFQDVVRPHTPGPRRLHLLGLHPAALPEEGRACGSTSSWPPPPWPPGSPAPRSTARNARARAPRTTPP